MLIFVLITVGKHVDGGGQEQAKEGKQIEGDLGEDSSEGTTSGKCADVGGKEPAAKDTGKDGDLVEGGQHGRCDQGVQGRMSHMPHARALGGWGRERGEGARMDFFSLPIRKKGGRG